MLLFLGAAWAHGDLKGFGMSTGPDDRACRGGAAAGRGRVALPQPQDRRPGLWQPGRVLLFVIAVIMGIHALGGLDYHPTDGELDALKGHSQ